MRKGHHLAERRQAILNALVEAGQLSVEELSQRFAVSEVTIRTDLEALHQQNVLLRTRGGAMAIRVLPELSFDVRQQQHAEKKTRIGKAAAQLIHNSDTIALDPSTTALAIIPFLENLTELTVVTNSLKAAIGLLRLPQVQVIIPGGYLRREAISLVGQPDASLLRDINIRIGFFGARGFTLKQGLTEINLEEVRTKQKIIQNCQVVVGVIDGRKWGQVAVATFAPLDHIHMIITDDSAPPEQVKEAQAHGVEVLVV